MTSSVFLPDAQIDGRLRPTDEIGRSDAYLPRDAVQNHAANLATLPGGDLACVWFGGTQEGVPDVSIWFSRLPAGSTTWSAPVRLSSDGTRSEQNPVLFVTPEGHVWLLHTAQQAGDQDTAEVRRRVSLDGGRTWGETTTLVPADDRGGVFVRQPITVTRSGRWILPIFLCTRVPGEQWVGDRDTSSVLLSDDGGGSWREVPVPESTGAVHMNVHELPDGTLLALFRSRWADSIHSSRSADDGETWSAPRATTLPNNNSSVQYVVLADGDLALVFNPSSRADATDRRVSLYDEIDDGGVREGAGPQLRSAADDGVRSAFWGAPRAPMALAVSSDAGQTWTTVRHLDEGDGYALSNNSRDGANREFSYPTLLEGADGRLDIAYTYFRQAIKHVRLEAGWREATREESGTADARPASPAGHRPR
jgi:predicted neuraminidase